MRKDTIIAILRMRKLSHTEIKQHTQGHRVSQLWAYDSNTEHSTSEASFLQPLCMLPHVRYLGKKLIKYHVDSYEKDWKLGWQVVLKMAEHLPRIMTH